MILLLPLRGKGTIINRETWFKPEFRVLANYIIWPIMWIALQVHFWYWGGLSTVVGWWSPELTCMHQIRFVGHYRILWQLSRWSFSRLLLFMHLNSLDKYAEIYFLDMSVISMINMLFCLLLTYLTWTFRLRRSHLNVISLSPI